jgi:hypothetical protein
MQLVYYKPNMTRRVSFELLNRQLVWLGFSVRRQEPIVILNYNLILLSTGIFAISITTHQYGQNQEFPVSALVCQTSAGNVNN